MYTLARRSKYALIGMLSALLLGGLICVRDTQGASTLERVKPTEESFFVDLYTCGFYEPILQWAYLGDTAERLFRVRRRAGDVNVFDEVPDSTWFTNRNGRERLSRQAIQHGPGPVVEPHRGPWTVLRGKTTGKTPGLVIQDRRGYTYYLKFDAPKYPHMTTAAEVISSRLFHAIGYHVPLYTILQFRRNDLHIAPTATYRDANGFKQPLTPGALDMMLQQTAQSSEGTYCASASLQLPGTPKGPFSLSIRRTDDPDDLINHRNRRVVRALKVFAAWLNHHDIRPGNTLDMLIEDNGQSFLKHYLIDFGSTLGSDNRQPKAAQVGHTYLADFRQIARSTMTLGFDQRPWEGRGQVAHDSVGYIESEQFDAKRWKPMLPNKAFGRLSKADGFWAAKIVMSFTDEHIAAAVDTGMLPAREAAAHLTRALIERRNKVGQYWYQQTSALDHFRLSETAQGDLKLQFEDLAVTAGFVASHHPQYQSQLITLQQRTRRVVADDASLTSPELVIRRSTLQQLSDTDTALLRITARHNPHPIELWLRKNPATQRWALVGINRDR